MKKTAKSNSAIISDKVKDYGKDPFFVNKAKQSKAFLEKHGFPQELIEDMTSSKGKLRT
ncbi:hypothetical protein BH10BAC4_BH10BAC4_20410 [soil metagenome]